MNETTSFLSLLASLAAIFGVLALAFNNYKQGKGVGLTSRHRSEELSLSAFEKINNAQAMDLKETKEELQRLEEKVVRIEAANEVLRRRDSIRETRELTLAGLLSYHGHPIPALPEIPSI